MADSKPHLKKWSHTCKTLSTCLAKVRRAQPESAAKPTTHYPTCGYAPGCKHLELTLAGSKDFKDLIYLYKCKNKTIFYLARGKKYNF